MNDSLGAYLQRLVLLAVTAAACLAAGGAGAQPAEPPPATTAAFVLTMSGRAQGIVPVPASDVRAEASSRLAETLSQRGFRVLPRQETLSLQRQWRVRDGRSIPLGFLAVLADSIGVDLLMVSDLVVQHDRVLMTARYVDTRTGVMRSSGITEVPVTASPGENGPEWLLAVGDASADVAGAPIPATPAGGERSLILEATPVGCSESIALVASHTLFDYRIAPGDAAWIDPAVTSATLHSAGYSERYLGADARALLRDTFGCSLLMIPQLISYAPERRSPAQLARFEDTTTEEPLITDFAMNLRVVDLATGAIAAGAEAFLPVPEPTGWFGIPRDDSLINRFRTTARRLWSDMNNTLKEL